MRTEGFTQRKLPDRRAFPVSTAMHWAFTFWLLAD